MTAIRMHIARFCFTLVLILPALARADVHRVYLGRMDLAGLVPSRLPGQGALLRISDPEQPVLTTDDRPVGYVPVVFRPALERMRRRGLRPRLEVEHRFASPRPGKFLSVNVWVDTDDPDAIEPLVYRIPVHAPDELAGP